VAESPSFFSRVWLSWVCSLRVLFDAEFARRVQIARSTTASLPAAAPASRRRAKAKARRAPARLKDEDDATAQKPAAQTAALREQARRAAALQLLGLLQREGRLIDFLQQDIAKFDDAEIGAAARVVHAGCRKALAEHAEIGPVRTEPEGERITIESVDPAAIKLTGDVKGAPPYSGVLRHRGWRAASLKLPTAVADHDLSVLAPAEVEL